MFPLSTLIRWDNIVIAGHKQAVDRAIDAAKKLGLKEPCYYLSVFHLISMLMKKAADEFEEALNKVSFNDVEIPDFTKCRC